LEKLHIYYGTNEVKQITRFSFVFENSGRTPIQEHDIIVPIQLSLNSNCAFIDTSIEKLEPPSVTATAILANSNRTLQLQFPLVNPSDKIIFSGLVSGTNPIISLQSRVVGVREVRFVDESLLSHNKSTFSNVLPNIVFAAIIGLAIMLRSARSEQRQARTAALIIESDSEKLSKFTKKTDFLNYVRGRLDPYTLHVDQREIISKIETLAPEEGITQELKPQVIQAIKDPIQQTIRLNTTAIKVIWSCVVVGIAAAIYFIWKK
jgi:hypothetical protein